MAVEPLFISGFMAVKNVVAQGYPFLEAIVAALPVCDEFLISEGYSTDETWEAVQWVRSRYPDKIKLYRDRWHGPLKGGEQIAVMQNAVLERCRGNYLLSVQANEIFHEASYAELRALPQIYPGVEIFNLPFYTMLGSRILWWVDFRKRLFKNKPYIRSVGDGFDVYYLRSRLWRTPRMLLNLNLRGLGVRPYYLPQPIFRYTALCPQNYLLKLQTRKLLLSERSLMQELDERHAYLESAVTQAQANHESVRAFWDGVRPYFDTLHAKLPPSPTEHIPRRTVGEPESSPRLIRHLQDRWEYSLQASYDALSGPAVGAAR